MTITIGVLLTLAGLRNTLGNSSQDGSMFLIPGVTIIVIAIVPWSCDAIPGGTPRSSYNLSLWRTTSGAGDRRLGPLM